MGGSFTYVGGTLFQVQANNIAAWDGFNWHALESGVDGTVNALEVQDGELFVGGAFTHAGGNLSPYFARWGPALDGDVTNDRVVNESDLGLLLRNWYQDVTPASGDDLTGDGRVDEFDLALVLQNWLATCNLRRLHCRSPRFGRLKSATTLGS